MHRLHALGPFEARPTLEPHRLRYHLGNEPAALAQCVPFDLVLAHPQQGSSLATLAEYTAAIFNEVDRMALRVGLLLRSARAEHPADFREWVDTQLPFGFDTARRLMAISEAYETRPAELLDQLPKPWQALYALRVMPDAALQASIASGEIGPETSERDAKRIARRYRTGSAAPLSSNGRHHRADIAAGALMEFTPATLNPAVRRALERWLRQ